MRLQQIVGKSSISQLVRHRLENNDFHSVDTAKQVVQRIFPNHVINIEPGRIAVQVKDKSFSVAVFKQIL